MNPVRLLIAAVLMAGLGGAVWWSNKKTAADAAKPPADTSPKVLALKQEDITQLEFKHREGPPSIVKKNAAGVWQVTAPKPLPADKYAIGNVTNLLSSMTSDRMVDDKVNSADLAGYGLAPALVEVDATMQDGKTTKLLIGEENATGSGVYAKVDGDSRLFLTATANKGTLDKTYKDLQDRHLLNFEQDKVSRVELTAKNQPMEFGRTGQNDWQILKPKPMRADGTQVQDLVQKLRDGVFDTVSDDEEKKLPAEFASAPQLALVKLTDANGTQTLEVHKLKEDYYGKSNLVPTPQKISHDLGAGLDKSLNDFRNKKLFDFGFSDPTRIEFKDGAKSAVYEKSGDKWASAGKPMDSLGIQALIDNLRDLTASKFVESGFTKPVIEVTVVSNDGKRTEKVEIAPTSGANFIARREGDSSLYELEVKNIQDLRKAAGDVREAQPDPASATPGKKK
jgi:hypothetical protein